MREVQILGSKVGVEREMKKKKVLKTYLLESEMCVCKIKFSKEEFLNNNKNIIKILLFEKVV